MDLTFKVMCDDDYQLKSFTNLVYPIFVLIDDRTFLYSGTKEELFVQMDRLEPAMKAFTHMEISEVDLNV